MSRVRIRVRIRSRRQRSAAALSDGGQRLRSAAAIANPGLIAHREALEAARAAIKLVMRLPAPLEPTSDQVIRSATSVPANLAEGHGRSGRDRLHFWRIACASAEEVDGRLRLLAATAAVSVSAAKIALDRFDHVRAMTWRLLDPEA